MKKPFLTAVILLMLTSVTAAASTSFNQSTTDLQPGQNQTLGTLTVHTDNPDTSIEGSTDNFPFPTTWTNVSTATTNNTKNFTGTFTAAPPNDFAPGSYTHDVFITLTNSSATASINYDVASVQNWTVNTTALSDILSVGSRGTYAGPIRLTEHGNVEETVSTNTTGGLAEYLSITDEISVRPGNPAVVDLSYRIPRTTPFGNYSGQLHLNDGNQSAVINLSSTFRDTIRPEIQDTEFPDLMATTETTQSVQVSDNLNVSTVTANISKVVEVRRNNQTVQVNRSVGVAAFSHVAKTERWTYTFTESDDITQYYADLTVTDGAGNTVNQTESFQVDGLNATTVVHSNFEFPATEPNQPAVKPVLRNDIETPVDLTLQQFTHTHPNSTVTVGIKKPGDEAPTNYNLDDLPDTITVDQRGTYELVVESDREDDEFSGQINVTPVPQHYPVPNIVFEGQVIDPQYPDPAAFTLGDFEGRIEFKDSDATVHQAIKFIGVDEDASECRGVDRWSQCIPGFTLGELHNVKQINDQLRANNTRLRNSRNRAWTLTWMFGGGFTLTLLLIVRIISLFGTVRMTRPVDQQKYRDENSGGEPFG